MINSLIRRSILLFILMASVLSIFFVLIFASHKTYASSRIVTINPTVGDSATAVHLMNIMCNSYAVGFGAYITDASINSSGVASYNVNIVYKKCNNTATRAYALVGNSGLCPLVGRYGGGNTGQAFDCVKYIGAPKYSTGSGLDCESPPELNDRCVYQPVFNSIAIAYDQPVGVGTQYSLTRSILYGIPASLWQQPQGSINIGAETQMCQFYKVKLSRDADWKDGAGIYGCQSIYLSVSWRERSYNLTPNIAIGIDRFTGQANIPIGADISQGSADDPVGENHNWFVTKAVFKAPINRGAVALSDDEPCTYFNKKSSNALRHGVCEEAIGGGKIYPGSGNYFGTRPTGNIPLGYYICYMTSVQNPTSRSDDDSKWRHSDIKCAQSVAIPKLQVHGGDLRVASDSNCTAKKGFINTSMSRIDGRHYGSWSEFASFSQCSDSNFTTGAELESGQASVTPIDPYHGLTFANGGGSYGSYSTDTNIVRGVQPITDCPASVPSDHRFSSFGAFKLSVDEGNVAGSYCVGNSSSNLNVDSDVKLTGKPSGIKQIPQVILIGKDINIHEGVSRLDAWLLASGDLNTCTNSTNNRNATLKSTVCNNQLVINGPVYTNKLYPDRTFGSRDENDKAKAGEIFNLPASTSIWLYNQSKTSGAIDTVSLKELPPRY